MVLGFSMWFINITVGIHFGFWNSGGRFEALSDDLDESLADKLAQAIADTSSRFKDLAAQAGGKVL